MTGIDKVKKILDPLVEPDKQFFLELLDADRQRDYENTRIAAVMAMLKFLYIKKLLERIKVAADERKELTESPDYDAEKYRRVLALNAEIRAAKAKLQEYKPYFDEPYFARMDVVDDKEGYNSYYIGKRGDEGLEIVDWRAPLARRYYQKSRTSFSINQYDYKLILRRALRTGSGKVLDMKNEYLSLSDYLTAEEIGGRGEELIFDPFLREILQSRKEKREICDIIETIQEKQYEIITLPEREQFIVQGVAGSGKTMILLHRLSYILYNNENLKPNDVLIITPSDSFNAFIDELATVLELERVKTSTLDSYFINMLKSVGIDVRDKIDLSFGQDDGYAAYIYSEKFQTDTDRALKGVYDNIYGMFASDDCREVSDALAKACQRQTELYDKIKNASLRVRRCVLGEIKEKPDGGLYYTKQFRYMFNCVQDVKEFLGLVFGDARMNDCAFFYRQLMPFYKSLRFLSRYGAKICAAAERDLRTLKETVTKELNDLKRYKTKTAAAEEYTYADGINRKQKLLAEIEETQGYALKIADDFGALADCAEVLKNDVDLNAVGKCESDADILRFFYRKTLRKYKQRNGFNLKPLHRADAFAMCDILVKLGYDLSPKYSFVFVDEGQDISLAEYGVLKTVNDRAAFNIFGDLKQNVTPFRGVRDWDKLGLKTFGLTLNYRNTNQIVNFVSGGLDIEMQSIGFGGSEISRLGAKRIPSFFAGKNGLKAIICSAANYEKYKRKSYNCLRETGKISKTKINIMTVYESKGLEFTAVAVDDCDMSDNEKYIAYTRALKDLAIISG